MMNVPKLRFKEFTDEWQHDKICNVTTYVDYRGKTPNKTETGIFLVTAKNVKKGYIDYDCSKEYVAEIEYEEIMHRGKPKVGDVLITTEAPCGNVAQIDKENIALAQRVIKYRGNALIDNTFLKYEFLSNYFQNELKKVTSGGTVSGVKGSILHNMEIHYCSKEEQLMLSSFLTLLDKKIELQTKKIEDLKLYTQSLIKSLIYNLNCNKKRIFELFTVSAGGDIKKEHISSIKTKTFCYPIYSNNLDKDGLYGYSNIYKIKENSITITGRGEIGVAKVRNGFYYPIVRLIVLIPKKNYNLKYFQEAINNIKIIPESTGIPQLTAPQISNYFVNVPTIDIQNKIGTIIEIKEKKIFLEELKLKKLQELKKGLMQNMFV